MSPVRLARNISPFAIARKLEHVVSMKLPFLIALSPSHIYLTLDR
jgi:hypothetical protein